MNDLQKKELEILKYFIQICDELNLKYYLVCGSALGAVKYKGFIPWDDDVDVALLRPDYERFLEKAPEMLPEWIFVQNYRTEKEFPLLMTKLRDSRTTLIEEDFAQLPIHHGIFVDVFPLDGYPQDSRDIVQFEKKKKYLMRRQFVRMMGKRGKFGANIRTTGLWFLYRFFGYCKDTRKLLSKYEKFLASYPVCTSRVICNHGNWQGKLEYAEVEQYGEGIEAEFEGISVRIPERFDAYLRQKYGDYMQELPIEQQKSHHKNLIVDCGKSYKAYMKKV